MLAFVQILIVNMQIMNINAVNVNRRDVKRCGNAVKLLGNIMVYITGFARVVETTQVQSQTGSPVWHRLHKPAEA